jgi:hypothetical protein
MAIGHGGQVIVSESTYTLVRDDAPADASFVDLGDYRLKDLARPERVYQMDKSLVSVLRAGADVASDGTPHCGDSGMRSIGVMCSWLRRRCSP